MDGSGGDGAHRDYSNDKYGGGSSGGGGSGKVIEHLVISGIIAFVVGGLAMLITGSQRDMLGAGFLAWAIGFVYLDSKDRNEDKD
ncbi:hypothetical protein [Streptomyces californicus]|uniref:hypothetical protein n=1 Tax=Streptomyces californicus TaxID=67351 RepID=UPI0036C14534